MLIDNLAKLNSRSRNAISAALIVITTIVLYGRLVTPHVMYLYATQEYGYVLSDMIKTGKIVKSAVEIKKKKLKELGGRFAYLQNALFSVKEAKEFFSDIQAIFLNQIRMSVSDP